MILRHSDRPVPIKGATNSGKINISVINIIYYMKILSRILLNALEVYGMDDPNRKRRRGLLIAMADTILKRFRDRCEFSPDSKFCTIIFSSFSKDFTYKQIGLAASNYTRRYLNLSLPPKTIVLIFLNHTEHLYAAFIGAMEAGLVPSFMPCPSTKQDPAFYWAAHGALLDRIGSFVIVASADTVLSMKNAGLNVEANAVLVEGVDIAEPVVLTERYNPEGSQTALLQHSSGTTGLKKGVSLTFSNIELQLASYEASIGVRGDDVIVSWLPLYHDMGLIACFLLPMHAGIPFIHMDPFHWLSRPTILFEMIARYQGTLVWLPNFAFDHLRNVVSPTNTSKYDLKSIRLFTDCSEPCRPATLEQFSEHFHSSGLKKEALQCCYAMAETVFAVAQTPPGKALTSVCFDRKFLGEGCMAQMLDGDNVSAIALMPCGPVIDGIEAAIFDADGEKVAPGYVGQIAVKGKFVFAGYYKNEALTKERFTGGWYATQDIGFFWDGNLFVLGRRDDVIICNGKNVYAHDVEALAAGVEGLKPGRCVVLPFEDAKSGTQKLIIVSEYMSSEPEVLAAAKKTLQLKTVAETGVAPHSVRLVPQGWLLKTTSGKISREANLQKLLEEPGDVL